MLIKAVVSLIPVQYELVAVLLGVSLVRLVIFVILLTVFFWGIRLVISLIRVVLKRFIVHSN